MALFAKHGLSSEAPPTGGEAGAKAEVSLGGWELHRGVGSRLMHQAGWRPGQGLGARNDGRVDPIPANLRLDRTCVGHPEAQAMPSEQAAHQLNHFSPARGRGSYRRGGGGSGERRSRRGGRAGVEGDAPKENKWDGDVLSPKCRWCQRKHPLRKLQKHEASCHRSPAGATRRMGGGAREGGGGGAHPIGQSLQEYLNHKREAKSGGGEEGGAMDQDSEEDSEGEVSDTEV